MEFLCFLSAITIDSNHMKIIEPPFVKGCVYFKENPSILFGNAPFLSKLLLPFLHAFLCKNIQ